MKREGAKALGAELEVEDAVETVLQQRDVEIDQQAQGKMQQAQVGPDLHAMHGQQGLDRLGLNQQPALHDQVGAVGRFNGLAAVNQGDGFLALDGEAECAELDREAFLVGTFQQARAERALRLPGANGEELTRRAADWAEVRPEWGLAGCGAFIAAPRSVTAGRDLQGRAFLHSYDWRQDRDFATLELILTAPVVVASWISLQYYGSTVAPETFGGGNKLIHNVVGGIGVVEGNGGLLRPGLPVQTLHDGEKPAHEALRLSVLVEAPVEAITDILRRHDGVRQLFDNGWLHLLALKDGRTAARYRPGLAWETIGAATEVA